MNIISTIKTLPLLGAFAIGLTMTPALSVADGNDRGRHNDRHTQQNVHYNQSQHRGNIRNHSKQGYQNLHGHKRTNRRHGHKHQQIVHNYNGYNRNRHQAPYVQHSVQFSQPRHFLSLSKLGLMFGLHTDNVDIIYRD